ncbi:hypothetical protein D9M68_585810 [compost metagenome]
MSSIYRSLRCAVIRFTYRGCRKRQGYILWINRYRKGHIGRCRISRIARLMRCNGYRTGFFKPQFPFITISRILPGLHDIAV